jgi:hypothetical protein
MNERNWSAVPIANITVDGNANGYISVADTFGFYVKQQVSLKTTSIDLSAYEVKEVLSKTVLRLGPVKRKIDESSNLSAFTVAAGAQILAFRQQMPLIDQKDLTNALYAREPIVANRVINVDKYGNFYDESNLLNVNIAGGAFSGGLTDAELRASPVAVTVEGATFEITGGLRVDLNGFDPTTPDSVLLVGSSDGTATGTKRGVIVTALGAVKVDGTVAVSSIPLASNAASLSEQQTQTGILTSIDSKLTAPLDIRNLLFASDRVDVSGSSVSVSSLPLPANAATASAQATGNASLASIDGKLTSPLQVLSINELIPMAFDQVAITSKNANGDPLVILYKLATVTVATLTCTYDIDGDLSNVVRT